MIRLLLLLPVLCACAMEPAPIDPGDKGDLTFRDYTVRLPFDAEAALVIVQGIDVEQVVGTELQCSSFADEITCGGMASGDLTLTVQASGDVDVTAWAGVEQLDATEDIEVTLRGTELLKITPTGPLLVTFDLPCGPNGASASLEGPGYECTRRTGSEPAEPMVCLATSATGTYTAEARVHDTSTCRAGAIAYNAQTAEVALVE